MTIVDDLRVLASATQAALRDAGQRGTKVTVFRSQRGAVPGDRAWIQPVSTDETGVSSGPYKTAGTLDVDVRIDWHAAKDMQAAATRMTKMLDRSNANCVQAHLYESSIGDRLKVTGAAWGESTDDEGNVYVQGRVSVVVLSGSEAAGGTQS